MSESMSEAIAKPTLWTKDFIGLAISNLFLFISFQMLIPTLPVYMEQQGGGHLAIGMVIGIFTLSALITRPFAGKGLDTIGRRKILILGLIIFILSIMGYYLVSTVLLILGVRFIHGIGWGMATTTYGTIVSDLVPAERRGEGMGYFGLSVNVAMAMGPFIGIWFMNTYGFGTLFLVSTGLALFPILMSRYINFPEIEKVESKQANNREGRKSEEDRNNNKVSFFAGLLERNAFFPSLLVMLFTFSYGGIITFITLFGKEVGIENVGWFFIANACMVILTRPIAGILFDRKGHEWVLLPGVLFSIIGVFLLSYTETLSLLIIASLFYGVGFGAISPSLQAWTINRVTPNRRGAANGTFFSAFDLGIGLGAVFLGLVSKYTSYGLMYRFSIIFLLLFVILYVLYLYKERREN
jgi:MFS family permease